MKRCLALAVVLLLALPACGAQEAPSPWRGMGTDVEVTVWDMHCPGCELEVEAALGAVEGIARVRADHETGTVAIRLAAPESRSRRIDALREAIHANGRYVVGEDEIPERE